MVEETAPKRKRGNPNFKKGSPSINPHGRPPGRQSFVDRARLIMETYTMVEVMEMAMNIKLGMQRKPPADPELRSIWEKLRKVSMMDMTIMVRLGAALNKDGGGDLERLLDRILGKPVQQLNVDQTLNGTTTVKHHAISEIESWVTELSGSGENKTGPKTPVSH